MIYIHVCVAELVTMRHPQYPRGEAFWRCGVSASAVGWARLMGYRIQRTGYQLIDDIKQQLDGLYIYMHNCTDI